MDPLLPLSVAPEPPLCYTIDAPTRTIVIKLFAINEPVELLAWLQRIPRDQAFTLGFDVYVDCNNLRRIPSCDEVRALARACVCVPRTDAACRWALIATWRPIHNAARLFATVVSAPNVSLRVFEAWSDARLWFALTRHDTETSAPWVGPAATLNSLVRSRMGSA